MIKSQEDSVDLQDDVNRLVNWSILNKHPLNINKCSIITFSKSTLPQFFNYTIHNTPLTKVTSIRDLQVIFQLNIGFHRHYSDSSEKALRSFVFVTRNITTFNIIHATKSVFSLVRPALLFASVVCAPYYPDTFDRLEKIQNRFLRFAAWKLHIPYNKNNHDYSELRKTLNYLN